MANEQDTGSMFAFGGDGRVAPWDYDAWLRQVYAGQQGQPGVPQQPALPPDVPAGLPRIRVNAAPPPDQAAPPTPQPDPAAVAPPVPSDTTKTPAPFVEPPNASRPPQPWQGRSPRIAPAQDAAAAFGSALGELANQPGFRDRVANAVTGGVQWLSDKLGPAIPPEVRPKLQAGLEGLNAINPYVGYRQFTPSLQQGHFGQAALDLLGVVPGEGVAAGLSKLAAGLGAAKGAIFLGVGAKGLDKAALKQAKEMEKAGASPAEILDATSTALRPPGEDPTKLRTFGWEKRPDKKWRTEISDAESTFNPEAFANAPRAGPPLATPGVTLGDVFSHPELYKAEPSLAQMPIKSLRAQNAFGEPNTSRGVYSPDPNNPFIGLRENLTPEQAREVLLHEVQHAIQGRERFGAGGSTKLPDVAKRADKVFDSTVTSMAAKRDELTKEMQDWAAARSATGQITPSGIKAWKKEFPERAAYLDVLHGALVSPTPMRNQVRFDTYKNLQGETEARNVAARADLSPGSRTLLRPETTEDVARANQWVRFEPKASRGPVAEQADIAPPSTGDAAARLIDAGYSKIATPMTTADVNPRVVGRPALARQTGTPEQVLKIGDEIIPIITDRMRAGGKLTHVAGEKLPNAVPQEGGYDYPLLHGGKPVGPAGETRGWANAPPQSSGLINLGKEIQARGNNPVLMTMAMNKHAGDFANQMFRPTLDMMRADSGAKLRQYINDFMRAEHMTGPAFAAGAERWPGVQSKYLEDWLNSGVSGKARSKFVKGLDTREALDLGAPNIGALRYANTAEPLLNTPTGYMGHNIVDLNPNVPRIGDSGHSTYTTAVAGSNPRGFGGGVPPEIMLRDMYAGLKAMGEKSGKPQLYEQRIDYHAPKPPAEKAQAMLGYPLPKTQVVDQQLIDTAMEYIRKHGLKALTAGMVAPWLLRFPQQEGARQ